MQKVSFSKPTTDFFPSLQKSVNEYFKQNNLKPTGNFQLYFKALTLIPGAVIIYVALVFFTPAAYISIPLAGLLGFIMASIGFNVMHDACHGSYSTKAWVNDVLGLSLNVLGGNAFIWKQKHNEIHHTYTNVDGLDDDIAKMPLMRQCKTQKYKKMHKFQHVYVVLIYALSSFLWVALMDFAKYFSRKIYNTSIRGMDTKEHLIFWFSKVFYVVVYVAIPVYFLGWGVWAIGFFAMHVVMGLTLAIVFQLAHVVEETQFADVTSGNFKLEDEWAMHQMKTTADFSTDNKIISWLVGGLNFQVVHHLFPRVSHVHYPALHKILKETCERYNIEYIVFPSITTAIASHFSFMKRLGQSA
jgi:linoleoyl-CoA desaturase